LNQSSYRGTSVNRGSGNYIAVWVLGFLNGV
jgi:hypothetical protein